jgi:transcriptional regulator with XRE-family HTH domain
MNNLNLKAYLANVGMTMTEFCEKIGCRRTYLSTICSGKTFPGHRLAKDIRAATGGVINLSTRPKREKIPKGINSEQVMENIHE